MISYRIAQCAERKIVMKKILLPILLAISILLTSNLYVNAAEDISAIIEEAEQAQIDNIFHELNIIAIEKANKDYLESLGVFNDEILEEMGLASFDSFISERDAVYRQRELELEERLETLGVHKIDPSNPEDREFLDEFSMSFGQDSSNNSLGLTGTNEPAPDLNAVANLYTLFKRDGTKTYNNKTYEYRYIKVIDNKGYNGLTLIETVDPAKNLTNAQLKNILTYNFGYIVSTLLSSTPAGLVTDWTLGNIFNVLKNKPNAVISSSNGPIYRVTHTGVTSMTYYYLNNNGWRLIGVGAETDIIRDDYFAANVDGKPTTDYHKDSFSIKTSGIWSNYVEAYLANMSSYPSYCLVNEIGYITIRGYQNNLTYTPPYARYPSDLV